MRDEARQAFERVIVPRDFDVVEIPFPERGEPVHVRVERGAPRPCGLIASLAVPLTRS